MNITMSVFTQVLVMLLLIGVGFFCTKTKMISAAGNGQMSNILLKVVIPCVIISSFFISYDLQKLLNLGLAFLLGLLSHAIAIVLGLLLFRNTAGNLYRVQRFALVFSNCGFMAIPIISAVLGSEGIFYASGFLTAHHILNWSYGIYLVTIDGKAAKTDVICPPGRYAALKYRYENFSLRHPLIKCVVNPAIISVVLGLIIFLLQIPIALPLQNAISSLGSMNTPLSMIILGGLIAQSDLKNGIRDKKVYFLCFLRLLFIPAIMLLALWIIPAAPIIKMANIIATACPTAATVSIFSAKYLKANREVDFASHTVMLTTLLSLITMPVVTSVAGMIFGL